MGLAEFALLVGVIAIPVAIIFVIFLASLFVFSKLKKRNDHQA